MQREERGNLAELGRSHGDLLAVALVLFPLALYFVLAFQAVGHIDGTAYYFQQAQLLWDRVPMAERPPYTGRVLVEWIIAAMHVVAGPTMYWSGVIATVLAGAGAILLVAIWGSRAYGYTAAFIATLAMATCPMFVHTYATPESDPFMVVFWLAAILQFRQAEKSKGHLQWGLLGVWIGLSTLAKQLGVLLFPALVAYMLLEGKGWKEWRKRGTEALLVVAGGAMVLAIYLVYSRLWYGSWFAVFSWIDRVVSYRPGLEASLAQDPAGRGERLNYLYMLFSQRFAFIGWLYLVTLPFGVFRKKYRLEACFGLFYFTYLLFGTVSLTHYKRMWYFPRYILPLIPLMAVCFGGVIDEILARFHASRNALGRKWALTWAVCLKGGLVGLFSFSLLLGALFVGSISPFWVRTRMIQAAIAGYGTDAPTFFTAYFKSRYRGVVSSELWDDMQALPQTGDLPAHYLLVLDYIDAEVEDQLQGVRWDKALVTPQPVELSVYRRLVDHIRGRDERFYKRWYKPNFWIADIDQSRPSEGRNVPPWDVSEFRRLRARAEE